MKKSLLATAVLLLLVPVPLRGQLAVELRGGGAVGNHVPAASGFEAIPGPSWSLSVLASPLPWASLYLGYSRSEFGCNRGFCTGQSARITSEGWGGGVRVHPLSWIWVGGGGRFLATAVEVSTGRGKADATIAYETGAGLSLPIVRGVRLTPGIVYRAAVSPEDRTALVAGEVGLSVGW